MPKLIRKRQAAELLGVSAPRIAQLLRSGHLSVVADTGMLSRSEVEEFAQCREGLTPPKAPQTLSNSDLHACKLRQASAGVEVLKAAIAQHDLDARSGKLVPPFMRARGSSHTTSGVWAPQFQAFLLRHPENTPSPQAPAQRPVNGTGPLVGTAI